MLEHLAAVPVLLVLIEVLALMVLVFLMAWIVVAL